MGGQCTKPAIKPDPANQPESLCIAVSPSGSTPEPSKQPRSVCQALTDNGKGLQCTREAQPGLKWCGLHLKMASKGVPHCRLQLSCKVSRTSQAAVLAGVQQPHRVCQALIDDGKGPQCANEAHVTHLCLRHLKMGKHLELADKGAPHCCLQLACSCLRDAPVADKSRHARKH